jgi:hypothetical protein
MSYVLGAESITNLQARAFFPFPSPVFGKYSSFSGSRAASPPSHGARLLSTSLARNLPPPCDAVQPSSTSFPLVSTRRRIPIRTPLLDSLATVNEQQSQKTLTASRTLALRTHTAQSTSSPSHRHQTLSFDTARNRQDRCPTLHYPG